MTSAFGNPPSFGGNAGEPVPEVDPQDIKTLWHEGHDLQAKQSGKQVAMGSELIKAVCKPGANIQAVWYRSRMIWVLNQFPQEQLAPWVKNEQVSEAVFQTMATIPMKWVWHSEREGFPFDVEEFFRRLRQGDVQND